MGDLVHDKALIDLALGITHHFSSGVYIKKALLPAGITAMQHAHDYDHLSVLVSGRVALKAGDTTQEMSGFHVLEIRAGVQHEVTAIEDSVWLCVHATEETDPSKVDEVILKKKG